MPDVSVPDLEADARDLATATANLKRHIETEGLKIGATLGKNHAKAADERIKDVAAELQRRQDLERVVLDRHSERYGQVVRAVRAAKNAGETSISVEQLLAVINAPFEPTGTTDSKEN